MKAEKGSSMLIWIIGIIVMIAIIIWAIQFVQTGWNEEEKEDIKTEMLQVQAKAKIVLEEYHVDNNQGLPGEKMEDTSLEQTFGITDIQNYYKWTKETLEQLEIKDVVLEQDEYYLVNYDTEEVVYSSGYKAEDGNTYYTLTSVKEVK